MFLLVLLQVLNNKFRKSGIFNYSMFYKFYEAVKPTAHDNNNTTRTIQGRYKSLNFYEITFQPQAQKTSINFYHVKTTKKLNWNRLNSVAIKLIKIG